MEYRWIEKDPCIDIVRQALELSTLDIYRVSEETYKHGRGVAVSTIQNWLYGKTCRPQRYSLEAVLNALGADMQFYHAGSGQYLIAPEHFNGLREGTMTARRTPMKVELAA